MAARRLKESQLKNGGVAHYDLVVFLESLGYQIVDKGRSEGKKVLIGAGQTAKQFKLGNTGRKQYKKSLTNPILQAIVRHQPTALYNYLAQDISSPAEPSLDAPKVTESEFAAPVVDISKADPAAPFVPSTAVEASEKIIVPEEPIYVPPAKMAELQKLFEKYGHFETPGENKLVLHVQDKQGRRIDFTLETKNGCLSQDDVDVVVDMVRKECLPLAQQTTTPVTTTVETLPTIALPASKVTNGHLGAMKGEATKIISTLVKAGFAKQTQETVIFDEPGARTVRSRIKATQDSIELTPEGLALLKERFKELNEQVGGDAVDAKLIRANLSMGFSQFHTAVTSLLATEAGLVKMLATHTPAKAAEVGAPEFPVPAETTPTAPIEEPVATDVVPVSETPETTPPPVVIPTKAEPEPKPITAPAILLSSEPDPLAFGIALYDSMQDLRVKIPTLVSRMNAENEARLAAAQEDFQIAQQAFARDLVTPELVKDWLNPTTPSLPNENQLEDLIVALGQGQAEDVQRDLRQRLTEAYTETKHAQALNIAQPGQPFAARLKDILANHPTALDPNTPDEQNLWFNDVLAEKINASPSRAARSPRFVEPELDVFTKDNLLAIYDGRAVLTDEKVRRIAEAVAEGQENAADIIQSLKSAYRVETAKQTPAQKAALIAIEAADQDLNALRETIRKKYFGDEPIGSIATRLRESLGLKSENQHGSPQQKTISAVLGSTTPGLRHFPETAEDFAAKAASLEQLIKDQSVIPAYRADINILISKIFSSKSAEVDARTSVESQPVQQPQDIPPSRSTIKAILLENMQPSEKPVDSTRRMFREKYFPEGMGVIDIADKVSQQVPEHTQQTVRSIVQELIGETRIGAAIPRDKNGPRLKQYKDALSQLVEPNALDTFSAAFDKLYDGLMAEMRARTKRPQR